MTRVKNTSIHVVPEPSGAPLRSMAELMNEASICGGAYHRDDLLRSSGISLKRAGKSKRKAKK